MSEVKKTAREQVQEEIRAEIAKQDPIEGARTALEILAETSVQFIEDGGPIRYRIVGPDGEPRTTLNNGKAVDLTIRDIVAELREKHPTLFRSRPEGSDLSQDGVGQEAAGSTDTTADMPPAPARPPERDWLHVGSGLSPSRDRAAAWQAGALQTAQQHLSQALEGLAPRVRSVSGAVASRVSAVRGALSDRTWRQGWRANLPQLRPIYAYAAVGLAVLLAGASFFLRPVPHRVAEAQNRSARIPDRPVESPTQAVVVRKAPEPAATGTVPGDVPKAAAPPPSSRPEGPISGIPEVIDTATLRLNGKVVHLFGVEWARGGQVEELTSYLRGREVACLPAATAERYQCQVQGRDLSEVVLYNGGGRAAAGASPELIAAENHAKSERVGVWRK